MYTHKAKQHFQVFLRQEREGEFLKAGIRRHYSVCHELENIRKSYDFKSAAAWKQG